MSFKFEIGQELVITKDWRDAAIYDKGIDLIAGTRVLITAREERCDYVPPYESPRAIIRNRYKIRYDIDVGFRYVYAHVYVWEDDLIRATARKRKNNYY